MNIACRFRIYPTEEQKILLGKTFGCCRFLYNQMLNDKIRDSEKNSYRPFPNEAGHLPAPANLFPSEMDIPFYTWPVYFLTFSSFLHTLVSYH